jgi:hypothetical protein
MRTHLTRAAEGFGRRSFTAAEILRMQDAGIISEDGNFELIEGETVPMRAKSHVHERIKIALNIAIAGALPSRLWMGVGRRAAFVHQEPQGERWRSIAERAPDEAPIIAALPEFLIRLATI